jgi:broad-specificity NMP kinase
LKRNSAPRSVVILTGGPGGGKTTLAAALILINDLHHAQTAIAVALEALDYGTAPTYFMPSAGEVRREAARVLGQLEPLRHDPVVFGRLARLMQEDADAQVCNAAYHALLALVQAPEAASS